MTKVNYPPIKNTTTAGLSIASFLLLHFGAKVNGSTAFLVSLAGSAALKSGASQWQARSSIPNPKRNAVVGFACIFGGGLLARAIGYRTINGALLGSLAASFCLWQPPRQKEEFERFLDEKKLKQRFASSQQALSDLANGWLPHKGSVPSGSGRFKTGLIKFKNRQSRLCNKATRSRLNNLHKKKFINWLDTPFTFYKDYPGTSPETIQQWKEYETKQRNAIRKNISNMSEIQIALSSKKMALSPEFLDGQKNLLSDDEELIKEGLENNSPPPPSLLSADESEVGAGLSGNGSSKSNGAK